MSTSVSDSGFHSALPIPPPRVWDFKSIESIVASILRRCFFNGYDPLHPKAAFQCRDMVINQNGAAAFACRNEKGKEIDVLYIRSPLANRTKNVVVFAETTSYQDRLAKGLPTKYKHFLDRGADIVLWNPTELHCTQYSNDLLAVLKRLKEQSPHQKIVVKGHCATVEPSIAAAAKMQDASISLILDRGYADTPAFARSFTVLSKVPLVRRVIQKCFSCDGMEHLKKFHGKVIFIAPKLPSADQIVYWAGKNLTYAMHEHRQRHGFVEDVFIKLGKESDHWSFWNAAEYQHITDVLKTQEIVIGNYHKISSETYPERPPMPFFKRACLPILIKSWCDCSLA